MARTSSVVDHVVDQIAERIAAGDYPPGRWLPPAGELGAALGVHRTTVGRALKKLSANGVVVLYPNQGAKVATRSEVIVLTAADILEGAGDWRGFPASVYRAGGQPFNDITSAGEVPASADVASRLGVEAGSTVFARARIQGEVENGHRIPIQLSWSWFTMELADRVPAIRATPASGPSPVRDRVAEAGYRVRYDGRVKARHASPMERGLLELDGETAIVLDIWRTCIDGRGRPVEVSRLVDDAEKVELSYSHTPVSE